MSEEAKRDEQPPPGAANAAALDGKGQTQNQQEQPQQANDKPKKEKKVPEGLVIPPKKPKLTKAERRALQEQQRAAKAGGGGGGGKPQQQQQQQQTQKQQKQPNQGEGGGGGGVKAGPGGNSAAVATKKGDPGTKAPSASSSTTTSSSNTLVPNLAPFRDPADIFDHGASLLPVTSSNSSSIINSKEAELHPAVVALGYQYATGEIRGGNSRCRHMLKCFETLLKDFDVTTAVGESQEGGGGGSGGSGGVDYRHVLDQQVLKSSFQFWTERCRPHSVSMGNAFTVLKAAVASLDRTLSLDEMRSVVLETIQAYRQERIDYADRAIADLAQQKLFRQKQGDSSSDDDEDMLEEEEEEVILTYGYSEVVDLTLRQAALASNSDGKKTAPFRVIVVDSQPLLEGRRMLSQLRAANIECTYVLLNALTYVLQDGVTKVLLGASALMSDGSVWGRAGTACVALAAHAQHIPVLVCSETYKISNRVQLESLTNNELGAPYRQQQQEQTSQQQKTAPALAQQQGTSNNNNGGVKQQLNLLYDLTPAAFVSGIVTELGIIPPTSVAVLLREMNQPQG